MPDLSRLPDWPAMMGEDTAAAYFDVSKAHFRKHCPVAPVWLGSRKLFPRESLDSWWKAKAGGLTTVEIRCRCLNNAVW